MPALPTLADDALVQAREAAAAKAPEGVIFQLTLSAKQYHMGEPIAMTYAFSSRKAEAWKLDMGMYDRSGRLMEETFHVDPAEGVADPLADYFAMQRVMMGGGLRNMPPTLADKPVELKFDLNEWQRFDKAGKYRLYVESSRIAATTPPTTTPTQPYVIAPPPAVSNVVEFEVLPFDAAWSQAQLDEIKKTLGAKADEGKAARRLRFLNTPASVWEMATRLGTSTGIDWELQAGLIGASDWQGALASMQKLLMAPEQPVSARYLTTLQMLDVMVAEKGIPKPSWDMTAAGMQQYQQGLKDHQARMTEALAKYVDQLIQSLPHKTPAARAAALLAVQQYPANEVAKSDAAQAEALAKVFDTLPPQDQLNMLANSWPRVRTPALLPTLLKMLDAPITRTNDGLQLRDWALARAYELDPKTVRPLILAEMKALPSVETLPGSMHMQALLALPDATLPEMEATFAAQLEGKNSLGQLEMTARLISRYGTAAIEPQVKAVFERAPGRWACEVQTSMLAYFLRVDEAYGAEAFARCLASRQAGHSGCWRMLIGDVAQRIWTPALEKLAVGALNDRDAEVSVSAARVLKSKGSPATKDGLLAALAADYRPNPPHDTLSPKEPAATRRQALVGALLRGHRWVLTAEELQKIEQLAGAMAAQDCQAQAKATSYAIEIQAPRYYYFDGEPYVNLEELKSKLLLYPEAMRFTLRAAENDPAAKELLEWGAAHGRQITRSQM
jgi:hypothetical protein